MEIFDKEIKRKRLKEWVILDDLRIEIIKNFKDNQPKPFADNTIRYVSIAYDIEDNKMLSELPWFEIAYAYAKATVTNRPTINLPMIMYSEKKSDVLEKKYNWEYFGRTWYFFLHSLSSAYGWSIETVENLDVDDALALIQEILIDEQMDKEFQYSLSEIAYPYDDARKLNVFRPMERPLWMREVVKVLAPKKIKIRKDMMPMGLVIGSPKDDIEH